MQPKTIDDIAIEMIQLADQYINEINILKNDIEKVSDFTKCELRKLISSKEQKIIEMFSKLKKDNMLITNLENRMKLNDLIDLSIHLNNNIIFI